MTVTWEHCWIQDLGLQGILLIKMMIIIKQPIQHQLPLDLWCIYDDAIETHAICEHDTIKTQARMDPGRDPREGLNSLSGVDFTKLLECVSIASSYNYTIYSQRELLLYGLLDYYHHLDEEYSLQL